jgi:hypothetical protein
MTKSPTNRYYILCANDDVFLTPQSDRHLMWLCSFGEHHDLSNALVLTEEQIEAKPEYSEGNRVPISAEVAERYQMRVIENLGGNQTVLLRAAGQMGSPYS